MATRPRTCLVAAAVDLRAVVVLLLLPVVVMVCFASAIALMLLPPFFPSLPFFLAAPLLLLLFSFVLCHRLRCRATIRASLSSSVAAWAPSHSAAAATRLSPARRRRYALSDRRIAPLRSFKIRKRFTVASRLSPKGLRSSARGFSPASSSSSSPPRNPITFGLSSRRNFSNSDSKLSSLSTLFPRFPCSESPK